MSRNKVLVLLFYGSLVLWLFGCAKHEIKNAGSQGKNIICFGDSITFGYGVDPGQAYPAILGKLLNLPVLNKGVDGDTTRDGLKRLQSDVLELQPRLVLIEFGGNDFLKKIPREVTLNNLSQMVEQAQAKGAMVAIVDISAGMIMREYQPVFRRLAQAKGALFIPNVFAGIITNPSLKSDFLHPNAEGYKIIAQRIQRAISPYLNTAK
jgi:acyl-CoA thioesterase-1